MGSDFDLTSPQDKEHPISKTFFTSKKMIRIDDLQVFVQTAEAGSFSAAARRLSEEGARYLPHARAVLAALAAGQESLDQGRAEIAGPLRLSVPSDLGRQVLLPWLDTFQAEHPRLQLQLRVSDRFTDLFRAAVDAGIRYGQLADSGLVSLPLAADNRRIACAAPSYLERHGRPATPAELRQHNCLRYVMGQPIHERWSFHLPSAQGGLQTVAVRGDRISNDGEVVRRWALAGHEPPGCPGPRRCAPARPVAGPGPRRCRPAAAGTPRPPRATTSEARAVRDTSSATWRKAGSPISWPQPSLTALKWSTSSSTTLKGPP